MSHTVTVKIEMKNREAISMAAKATEATILHHGSHHLYGNSVTGLGVKLKGWNYPVVIKDNGEISYDNYNGAWGNINELEKFKEMYTLSVAHIKAQELGWYSELDVTGNKVTIYHPDGGTISVNSAGVVESFGFPGATCGTATEQLEAALGSRISEVRKPEYEQSSINQSEAE